MKIFRIVLFFILAACSSADPTPEPLVIDILDDEGAARLCAEVDTAWDTDWEQVVNALEILARHDVDCVAGQPSAGKLYAAHFNYGAALENMGEHDSAIVQYQAALNVNPGGREALAALQRLGIPTPTPPPLTRCAPDQRTVTLPPYMPSDTADFVTIEDGAFVAGDVAFVPRGVNYFPMRYPWRRFLTESDMDTIQEELTLIRETGFNSLRIFLWHAALFRCPGDGAIPVPDAFARLDGIIQEAAAQGFRLIVTLHDLPDLTAFPLYTNPEYTRQQAAFIVARYRDEAAIMAWDVRNEADIDYRQYDHISPEMVQTWLGETVRLVRDIDPNHLITAGWLQDELSTEAYVDFVSFHFWRSAASLPERIEETLAATEKPVVMEEFGYSTFNVPPETQAELFTETVMRAEEMGVDGWLIWTAFDFPTDATCVPPACPSADNAEHHFGLWTVDYMPKPAVDALQVILLP